MTSIPPVLLQGYTDGFDDELYHNLESVEEN